MLILKFLRWLQRGMVWVLMRFAVFQRHPTYARLLAWTGLVVCVGTAVDYGWRNDRIITIVVLAVVLLGPLLAAALLAASVHRKKAGTGVAALRAVQAQSVRRAQSAVAMTWVVGGIALACLATWPDIGPPVARALVATAIAAIGVGRGWSLATGSPWPRPAWVLALEAAKKDAPSGVGIPAAVVAIFIVALAGAAFRLPIGGLGAAACVIAATAARREVGARWAKEELAARELAATEVGAERVAEVRAVRPESVDWPADIDATTRHLIRKLSRDEHDDSSAAHLAKLYRERHGAELDPAAAVAACAERDARWGWTLTLTPDRVAADADQAALRLGERLGPEWDVAADGPGLRVMVMPCEPERLPSRVALEELLPPAAMPVDVEDLALPVARNSAGEPVAFNPAMTPHGVVAGEVGSGKTILLTSLATQALAHGWQLAVCEIAKGGLDFEELRPWCTGWASELGEALVLVRALYAEAQRRRSVLQANPGCKKWQELPPGVREATNIRPLLFIFDELASALIAGAPPRGLDKKHPLVQEAEERLAATSELVLLLGRLARETRYVGIAFLPGLQRPDVAILGGETGAGGELRSNLGWRVQMAPPRNLPSRTAVGMLFSGDATNQALSELARLNDGISPGLGVVWSEGGGVQAVRVAYHPPADIPNLLDRLGVPRHVGPLLGDAATTHPPAASPSSPVDSPSGPHIYADSGNGPVVHRRPDGSPRRVVSEPPGVDAAKFGIEPRYRLVLTGGVVAEAAAARDLTGLIVPGYDEIADPVERALALMRWARVRRLDAQARVAGPHCATAIVTNEERRVLAGVDRASGEWASSMPLVLVDADYTDEDSRPTGNLVWLRTRTDGEFLASLAAVGLVERFERLDGNG